MIPPLIKALVPDDPGHPDLTLLENMVLYDATGHILIAGTEAREITRLRAARGERVVRWPDDLAAPSPDLHYVDLSGDAPRPTPRPASSGIADALKLTLGEERAIGVVDACTVRITGAVEASLDHPGGALSLGFTMPGRYRIVVEPWPALPAVVDVEVAA